LTDVLGLTLTAQQPIIQPAAPFIDLLVEVRSELRKAKQFALADMVRNRLSDLGITLEDTPQGTRWKAADKRHV
jgi:cysteinyl-tRNA synthetase (EC 6.1.1.16)